MVTSIFIYRKRWLIRRCPYRERDAKRENTLSPGNMLYSSWVSLVVKKSTDIPVEVIKGKDTVWQ